MSVRPSIVMIHKKNIVENICIFNWEIKAFYKENWISVNYTSLNQVNNIITAFPFK